MAQQRLDFKAIKEAADFETILERSGIKTTREGVELVALCPFHDDHKPSLRVNPTKKLFLCFSCRASGNLLDFVARHERLTIREAAERIAEWCGIPTNGTPTPRPAASPTHKASANSAPPAAEPPQEHTAPKALTFALKLEPDHPYLAARGVSPELAQEFDIGFCKRGLMRGRVAIAIHDPAGELVGYAGRWPQDEVPDGEGKYKLPPHFKKSELLYNLHRVKGAECVTLVEGYFGVLALHRIGVASVALMGSTLSAQQEALLVSSGVWRLTLLLDGDEPGRAATAELLPRLAARFFVRTINLPQGTQPDTVPEAELRRLTKEASA
jgi:DNA primase